MKQTSGLYIYIILLGVILSSCANRVTPTGGAKDIKPPVVLKMEPANYSVNFNSRKVEIRFDEFVQLKDIQKQLIISPLMDPAPVITAKKKSIIIELPKELKPNTTYTINFGNAIADIHEDNVIESFQYIFSTGAVLDSLYCKGKAVDAYKQKGEKGISIFLYHNLEDSLPFKSKPDYYARTNDSGEFRISNISDGKYMIVAVNDKNGNYKCDSPQEEAISLDKIIKPGSKEVKLDYFKEEPSLLYIKRISKNGDKRWSIVMNKASDSTSIKMLNNLQPKYSALANVYKDTFLVWCADTLQDSLYIKVLNNNVAVDTARIKLKTTSTARGRGTESFIPVKPGMAESINCTTGLRPFANPEIVFKNPMKDLHAEKISLMEDSSSVSITRAGFEDSLKRKLAVMYKWKESHNYKLMLLPGAVTDFSGQMNDTIVISFTSLPQDNFGTLQLLIADIPSGNLVLQLIRGDEGVVREMLISAEGKYDFKTLDPGKYHVAILNDRNDNGRWDSGNYQMKTAPEKMYYFDGDITVRANWEMEQEWKVLQ